MGYISFAMWACKIYIVQYWLQVMCNMDNKTCAMWECKIKIVHCTKLAISHVLTVYMDGPQPYEISRLKTEGFLDGRGKGGANVILKI